MFRLDLKHMDVRMLHEWEGADLRELLEIQIA